MANALKALATEAGFYSSTQINCLLSPSESEDGKPSHKVADLRVVSGSMNAFLDVTNGYPATRAFLQSSAPLMHLASAKRAEQTKRAKYALIVENDYDAKESLRTGQHTYRLNGQKFIPFALEVNGSLDPSAITSLKSVADHAALTGAARDRGVQVRVSSSLRDSPQCHGPHSSAHRCRHSNGTATRGCWASCPWGGWPPRGSGRWLDYGCASS